MIFQPKIRRVYRRYSGKRYEYLSMSSHRDRWVCFSPVYPCVFFFPSPSVCICDVLALTRCKWVNIDLIDTTKGSGAYMWNMKVLWRNLQEFYLLPLCVHWPWWRCFLCCGTYEDIFLDKLPTDLCGLLMIVLCRRRVLWRIEMLLLSVPIDMRFKCFYATDTSSSTT